MICSICQRPLSLENCQHEINTKHGNNAEPVNDGRCCDDCNYRVVIPARINANTALLNFFGIEAKS